MSDACVEVRRETRACVGSCVQSSREQDTLRLLWMSFTHSVVPPLNVIETASRRLPAGHAGLPLTALAPMQYITDAPFIRVIAQYGAPDYVFTEYFRVHADSRPERHILQTIAEHGAERPVFAQLIGEDISALTRTARELCAYPVAGIDLNLGCPAPLVYRKNVGGGLLREPARVDKSSRPCATRCLACSA